MNIEEIKNPYIRIPFGLLAFMFFITPAIILFTVIYTLLLRFSVISNMFREAWVMFLKPIFEGID